MALVLGAQVGDAFLVGRRRILVTTVHSPTAITIRRDDGRTFSIGSDGLIEILPDGFIGVGPDPATRRLRLLFAAALTVLISRDNCARK